MGKRKRRGRCEFFLRNTWGNSCEDVDWQCNENPDHPEAHGYWVDGEALAKNTFELLWLKPRVKKRRR
jgi:hypothetical protein